MAVAQASVGSVGRFADPYENISIDTCDSGYTPHTDGFLGLIVGGESWEWPLIVNFPTQVSVGIFVMVTCETATTPTTSPPKHPA